MSEGTYTVLGLRCGNCRWLQVDPNRLQIPKGTPVEEQPCPSCGCKTLAAGGVRV
jgi:hypothetical protein